MTDTALQTKLNDEVISIETRASRVTVNTDEDYSKACEYVKTIKTMQQQVSDYWEPMRVSAKKAYDDVLAHKKAMTDPLMNAEKILKGKLTSYLDRKRREEEERRRELEEKARQEAAAKLAEAEEAEKRGDSLDAEYARAEAELMQSTPVVVTSSQPVKAPGVTAKKSWVITSIDIEKVPVSALGVLIRPVDEKAVMKLIRESHGTVNIPGITYEETSTLAFRTA